MYFCNNLSYVERKSPPHVWLLFFCQYQSLLSNLWWTQLQRHDIFFFISLRELQYHVTCQINEACSLSLLAPKHGSTHHYNACALTAPFRAYYTCSLLTFAHWTSKLLPSHKIGATCFCLAGDIWVGQLFSQSPDTLVMRFRWKVGVRSPENLILFLQTCCSKSVKGYLWLWMGQN